MKNAYLIAMLIALSASCSANIHVNMFATPQVLIYNTTYTLDAGRTLTFYIQDSSDYYGFTIATNLAAHNLCFVEPYNNYYSAYSTETNTVADVVMLNCGDTLDPDTLRWQALATLAMDSGSANFDAQGPHYLGFKRKYPGGYEYGWFKVSCTATGDTLTVYGYAYNDQVSETPNIVAGQGECVNGIAAIPLQDVSVICYNERIRISAPLPLHATLMDMQGQIVREWSYEVGLEDHDCSGLPHGVYLVEVKRENESRMVKVVL